MLTPAQHRLLLQVLQAAAPGARFAVFGSRAKGRARPHSDLDLLVLSPPQLTWQQRADLRDALEASELPFHSDIVEWGALSADMRERVLAEAIPLDDEPARLQKSFQV